jgi:hypothetical protein
LLEVVRNEITQVPNPYRYGRGKYDQVTRALYTLIDPFCSLNIANGGTWSKVKTDIFYNQDKSEEKSSGGIF